MYPWKKKCSRKALQAPGPSRSTRAAIPRPGVCQGARVADLEADSCKIEGPLVPGRASNFFGLQGDGVPPSSSPCCWASGFPRRDVFSQPKNTHLGRRGGTPLPAPVVAQVRSSQGRFSVKKHVPGLRGASVASTGASVASTGASVASTAASLGFAQRQACR